MNASLAWTSVASVTILSSTSGEFHSLFLTFPYGCEWEYEGSSDGQKKNRFLHPRARKNMSCGKSDINQVDRCHR